MTRRTTLSLTLTAAALLLGTTAAKAQHIVHPSALQPGANVMIPGSQQLWFDPVTGAQGFRYLGADGQWHGSTVFTDPHTGQPQMHTYSKWTPPGGTGTAPGPRSGGSGPGFGNPPRTTPGFGTPGAPRLPQFPRTGQPTYLPRR